MVNKTIIIRDTIDIKDIARYNLVAEDIKILNESRIIKTIEDTDRDLFIDAVVTGGGGSFGTVIKPTKPLPEFFIMPLDVTDSYEGKMQMTYFGREKYGVVFELKLANRDIKYHILDYQD